ncbi:sugar phosphate isomerase/epimerase [Nonomuraea sp. NPDC005650]|uniref:sugar phosphate isomerase/epimerase family protein n=1 Tax=Nonomuraea sp. NPDC005650 TaxID=3157045 RepID=UPI0033AAC540
MTTLPPLACSTITFRHYELRKALDAIADLGFDQVDLGALAGLCEHVPPDGSAAVLAAVAAQVRASSLAVTSVNADPGSFNAAESHPAVLGAIHRLLDFCADAGSPRLVLTCGAREQPAVASHTQIGLVADGLNTALERAQDLGIELVVEAPHHFRLVNTIPRTQALLAALSPAVRQAWDVSHVRASGADPAGLFPQFAPRVSIVHLRDALLGDIRRPMGLGDVDFGGVFSSASASGFEGPFVLELETHDSPFETKEEEVRSALNHLSTAATSAVIGREER